MQSFFASAQKSPTADEPAHIAAGLSYLQTGIFHFNLQHPPLLKELSAAALTMAGIRFPRTPEAMQAVQAPPNTSGQEWTVGYDILRRYGPDREMFWARLPMILVGALLGIFLYLFGRRLIGEAAAPRGSTIRNVDWGQGLKQLKSWLDAHAPSQPLYMATFCTIPPQDYGIRFTRPSLEAALPALRRKLRMPLPYWVIMARPTAIVGHAYYVYDVPGAPAPAQPNASR